MYELRCALENFGGEAFVLSRRPGLSKQTSIDFRAIASAFLVTGKDEIPIIVRSRESHQIHSSRRMRTITCFTTNYC